MQALSAVSCTGMASPEQTAQGQERHRARKQNTGQPPASILAGVRLQAPIGHTPERDRAHRPESDWAHKTRKRLGTHRKVTWAQTGNGLDTDRKETGHRPERDWAQTGKRLGTDCVL